MKIITTTCSACNSKLVISVGDIKIKHAFHSHHIVPKRYGGLDVKNNKATLCLTCHKAVHQFYADKAIKAAVKSDPNFFSRAFNEYQLEALP